MSPAHLSPLIASPALPYADNFQIRLFDIDTKLQMPISQLIGHFHQDILLRLKI